MVRVKLGVPQKEGVLTPGTIVSKGMLRSMIKFKKEHYVL